MDAMAVIQFWKYLDDKRTLTLLNNTANMDTAQFHDTIG